MNYKLISMDFDGTLLTSDKKVTKRTKDILLKYKDNNYIIVGITGRNLSRVKACCDINIFDYLILCNGSYIYNVNNDSMKLINYIKKDIVKNITDYFKNILYELWYLSSEKYYIYNSKEQFTEDYFISIKNISEIKEQIGKIILFPKDNKDIKLYKEYIDNNFCEIVTFEMTNTDNNSNTKWLEINPKGIDKFETLKLLCNKLDISTNEVIFFGDGTNDLSVISQVGLGVAMRNALQEVKKQAKDITLSNDEDGIATFLERF